MHQGLIHHIELNVSNIQATITFWDFLGDLGYTVYQKWEHGQSWKLGETYIVFVQTEEKIMDVPYHRRRIGLNHLAFYANSREHVDELAIRLKEKGAAILYEDKYPYAGGKDHYALFFEDPDRIKVEIVAP